MENNKIVKLSDAVSKLLDEDNKDKLEKYQKN